MAAKEACAHIKINKLLEESGWRFFMEKVFHIPHANWVSTTVQKHPSKKANHVQLVNAYADQINIGELFG